jgi:hypothetical protein
MPVEGKDEALPAYNHFRAQRQGCVMLNAMPSQPQPAARAKFAPIDRRSADALTFLALA